ncbi:Vacuolar protein sorting-associated protein [Spatholobus suberectus]|nr:Vacuolar protein sorting-associated protein [Spatholobus suberectus]
MLLELLSSLSYRYDGLSFVPLELERSPSERLQTSRLADGRKLLAVGAAHRQRPSGARTERNRVLPPLRRGPSLRRRPQHLLPPPQIRPPHPHHAPPPLAPRLRLQRRSSSTSAVPLAAVSHIFSHKKSLRSVFASPRVQFQVSLSPEGRVAASGSRSVVVRGKGDCDAFLTKFWENWRARAWEEAGSGSSSGWNAVAAAVAATATSLSGIYSSDGTVRMVGVSGILRKEQEMWESTDRSLQEAFQDLNALMSKAKEMVVLAEKMRLKLLSGSNSQTNATNDEEMGSKEEMQDWLLSVGIISPVTKESAGALYHQQLSCQLADFVKVPLERAGGIINLIDIYCLFNRARGTELISPDDLLQACSLWEKFDVPVVLRKFDSGVMVIQTKSQSDKEVFAKIKMLVMKPDALRAGISASDAARTLGVAPAMAKEHLLSAESKDIFTRSLSSMLF